MARVCGICRTGCSIGRVLLYLGTLKMTTKALRLPYAVRLYSTALRALDGSSGKNSTYRKFCMEHSWVILTGGSSSTRKSYPRSTLSTRNHTRTDLNRTRACGLTTAATVRPAGLIFVDVNKNIQSVPRSKHSKFRDVNIDIQHVPRSKHSPSSAR